jgi:hypothetical protein
MDNFPKPLCTTVLIIAMVLNVGNALAMYETAPAGLLDYNFFATGIIIVFSVIVQLKHSNEFQLHNIMLVLSFIYSACYVFLLYGRYRHMYETQFWCDDCNQSTVDCRWCFDKITTVNEDIREADKSCLQLGYIFTAFIINKMIVDVFKSRSDNKLLVVRV